MKPNRRMLMRGVAAVLMIVMAASGSFLVKDFLALRDPQNALPKLQVSCGEALIPPGNLVLASYSWRFLLVPHEDTPAPANVWQQPDMPETPVSPNLPLEISFSYDCKEMYISRADNGSSIFLPVSGVEGGGLYTPPVGGEYIYRVEAFWGWLGSVQYYFKLTVAPG